MWCAGVGGFLRGRVGRARRAPRPLAARAHSSATGIARKATASEEPTRAIHTTETAAGTRTRKAEKWSLASRKPKAELIEEAAHLEASTGDAAAENAHAAHVPASALCEYPDVPVSTSTEVC